MSGPLPTTMSTPLPTTKSTPLPMTKSTPLPTTMNGKRVRREKPSWDPKKNPRLKMDICKFYLKNDCHLGLDCTFAHGEHELRVSNSPLLQPTSRVITSHVGPTKKIACDSSSFLRKIEGNGIFPSSHFGGWKEYREKNGWCEAVGMGGGGGGGKRTTFRGWDGKEENNVEDDKWKRDEFSRGWEGRRGGGEDLEDERRLITMKGKRKGIMSCWDGKESSAVMSAGPLIEKNRGSGELGGEFIDYLRKDYVYNDLRGDNYRYHTNGHNGSMNGINGNSNGHNKNMNGYNGSYVCTTCDNDSCNGFCGNKSIDNNTMVHHHYRDDHLFPQRIRYSAVKPVGGNQQKNYIDDDDDEVDDEDDDDDCRPYVCHHYNGNFDRPHDEVHHRHISAPFLHQQFFTPPPPPPPPPPQHSISSSAQTPVSPFPPHHPSLSSFTTPTPGPPGLSKVFLRQQKQRQPKVVKTAAGLTLKGKAKGIPRSWRLKKVIDLSQKEEVVRG